MGNNKKSRLKKKQYKDYMRSKGRQVGQKNKVTKDADKGVVEQRPVESPLFFLNLDEQNLHDDVTSQQESSAKQVDLKLTYRDGNVLEKHPENSRPRTLEDEGVQKCGKKRKISELDEVGNDGVENEEHELLIEYIKTFDVKESSYVGHRIIDINFFTKELTRISEHASLFECNLNTLQLVKEIRKGLNSELVYLCSMCNKEFKIKNSKENLNKNAVTGAMVAGCGNAQLQNFTAALDLPQVSPYLYEKSHDEICQAWEETALDEMRKAGEEEKQAAIADGRVNKDGIPVIDVIIDGCWCKRSYKTNYAALSGAASIIGRRFGKVLFFAVKNKYCCICARAEKRDETAKQHTCYKNFSGPSTAMESEILVEGFKRSMEMHQVIYSRFIADGDSSTYAKILKARPYQDITVEKIGCRNHILRNFCNKLQLLKLNTKFDTKQRKMVTTERILSARKYICQAIKYHHENRQLDSVEKLHHDINISVQHAYSKHANCNKSICSKESHQSSHEIFKCRIWATVRFIVGNVASQARSLIENVDSNVVERFNGVIAKFVGGKRVNYALRRSYQGRVAGAVVSFNSGKIYTTVQKKLNQGSPSKRVKIFEESIEKKREMNKKILRKKNRNLIQKRTDLDYGENVDTPDMDTESFTMAKMTYLKNLEKCEEEQREIEETTKLQNESGEWMELRRKLLTSSNFGKVVKRRKTNPCSNIVKNMLYQPNISHVASINHGKMHEQLAREQLSDMLKVKIELCGLFIDEDQPFLGASPDGIIVKENTLVEIKCPMTAFKSGIDEAIKQGKIHFWKVDKKSGQTFINKKSDWFMQVQGQMHVCKIPKCILAVWYGDKKIKIEVIEKDDDFWREHMEANLSTFYMDCLLPELVDPRFTRGRPIREPSYVKFKTSNKENANSKDKDNGSNVQPNVSEDVRDPTDESNVAILNFFDF